MAEQVNVEAVRILRRGGGAAILMAFLSLIIAAIALVFAFTAIGTANDSKRRADSFEARLNASLGQSENAATGAGVGPNVEQPAADANTSPSGNGQ